VRPPTAGASKKLERGWALLFGIGWPAAVLVMMAIEPAPADKPSLLVTAIGTVLFFALYMAIGGTVARAVRRSPSAANWSSVAGLVAVVATITCPLSGHHHGVGAWWYVQLGMSVGMLALSRVAADRRHATAAS
jgi:hypothetical protein